MAAFITFVIILGAVGAAGSVRDLRNDAHHRVPTLLR